jgi:peptide/nickel transport system permease protein
MLRYSLQRLGQAIPTLFLVSVGVFMLARLLPGDPVIAMLGPDATPEAIEVLREQYRFDDPLWSQYFSWLGDMIRGDFGTSLATRKPVTDQLAPRLTVTATLAIFATLITIVVAIPLGVLAAVRKGKVTDRAILLMSIVGISLPSFFVGMILIVTFSVQLGLLPAVVPSLSRGWGPFLEGMILPAATLGLLYTAIVTRMTRASMLEVLDQGYIVTAKATGLSRLRVLFRHGFVNALIPIITIIGLNLGGLLGGSVVTEAVFNIPGIGTLLVNSIGNRDYPVVQAVILLAAVFYILLSLAVDLLYAAVNPRVRYGRTS